ncbi:hypothetical protein WJX74_001127 [Apatococcus lobatus]|uniref:Alpha-aminoacylpeptide hydrolase n=1 Tax=Apatococcus lobatus TaxID=904363 RepID=A0AAW1RM97_9CHLO
MVLNSTFEIEQGAAEESETAPLLSFLRTKRPSPTGIKVIAAGLASVLLVVIAAIVVRLPGQASPDVSLADQGLYLPPGMYTPLEYDIRLFLDESHFLAGPRNASQSRFQGRCNITFAVEKASPFIWIHAAPSMRFLQAALILNDRGPVHDGVYPEIPAMLCLQYMGVPSYVPDCSRIMERTGPSMLRLDMRYGAVKYLRPGHNATLVMDFTAALGSWPDDSSGLYRSQPFATGLQSSVPKSSGRGLRDEQDEEEENEEREEDEKEEEEDRREDEEEEQEDAKEDEEERKEDEREDQAEREEEEREEDQHEQGAPQNKGNGLCGSQGDASLRCPRDSVLLVTQFEAENFRRAIPALGDEPIYKSRFMLSLEVPPNLTALGNMPVQSRMPSRRRPGYDLVSFQQSPPMPTYLLALAVGHLRGVSLLTDSGMNITAWTVPGLEDQTDTALQAGSRGFEFYQSYTKASLPLTKLDFVAVPGKTGAMENWGLLLFDEARMLTRLKKASAWDKWRSTDVVCHELAHQWFGNLVTCTDWGQLAVNEGLASFLEYQCVEAVFSAMPAWALRTVTAAPTGQPPGVHEGPLGLSLDLDASPVAPGLVSPKDAVESIIPSNAGGVHYYKGAALLSALDSLAAHFSPDVVQQGLQSLLTSHRLGNVGMEDVLASVRQAALSASSAAAAEPLQKLPGSWQPWLQAPGYPLISVNAPSDDDGTSTIRQHRFFAWGQPSLFELQHQEYTAGMVATASEAATLWPLVLTPHALEPQPDPEGLGAGARASTGSATASASASSSSASAGSASAASSPGVASSAEVAVAEVDSPNASLQPMEALTGTKAWVLDADGAALQRVNYSKDHWDDLADSLSGLTAADDSPEDRASLLRASHLVSDAFALCFAGHLEAGMMLRLARAAAASPASQTAQGTFLILMPLIDGLQQLQVLLDAASDGSCRSVAREELPASLLGDHAARMMGQMQPNGSLPADAADANEQSVFLTRLTQSKLLAFAALGGQRDVAASLCGAASAFLHDEVEMDPDASSSILLAAINQPLGCDLTIPGNSSAFELLRRRWENTRDIHTADRLLYSLASLRSDSHLQEMLQLAFGLQQSESVPYIPKKAGVLRAIANAGHGPAVAEFLMARWEQLIPSWGAGHLLELLATLPLPPRPAVIAAVEDFLSSGKGAAACSTPLRHAILGRLYHQQDWLHLSEGPLCSVIMQP